MTNADIRDIIGCEPIQESAHMHRDDMTKLEKLDWVLWYLKETLDGNIMEDDDTKVAMSFIESIRDCYIQDYK